MSIEYQLFQNEPKMPPDRQLNSDSESKYAISQFRIVALAFLAAGSILFMIKLHRDSLLSWFWPMCYISTSVLIVILLFTWALTSRRV